MNKYSSIELYTNVFITNSNYNAKYNEYCAKLQCIIHLVPGKLQIILYEVTMVLHYTTLQYVPFLTPTVKSDY